MATAQTIITGKTRAAVFLTLTINEGGAAAVHDALGDISSRVNSVTSRAPAETLTAVVGFGSDAWNRLFDGPRPKELAPFTALQGNVHAAPSTPGDILIHLKGDHMDLCYELGRLIVDGFGSAVTTVEEIHGFRYFEMRDLTGFVDGTENPVGEAAIEAITVGDEDPDFAGGSYVAIQRYVTDMEKWDALTVEQQEQVFGRTKLDNVEFPDDEKAPNAHIKLNVIEDADGNQIDVLRDNMPYAEISSTGEKGTFYIAYSSSPDVTDQMLRNMFIGDPPGTYDRLLDFTTAVTGVQFFVPTGDFLDDPPPLPGEGAQDDGQKDDGRTDVPADATPSTGNGSDGSLRIGSLH